MPKDSDYLKCRVCGLVQDEPPWGEDGTVASFNICECCGTEFGYDDATPHAVVQTRARWLAAGAKWFQPKLRPASWDIKRQLADIPEPWK